MTDINPNALGQMRVSGGQAPLAPEPRGLAELADETGVVAKWLGHAADALADDVAWEIAEPIAAANALEALEPLAERLASIIADLRRHRGEHR